MPSITKIKSAEISVTTANTVSDATVVRVYAPSASVITIADDTATTVGTFTIPAGRVEYVQKQSNYTLAATVAVLCSSVAFSV